MKKMHIAVVDDGISEGYFDSLCLEHDIVITKDFKAVASNSHNYPRRNHGTVCAGIVKKYCSNAKISSIKVLNDNMLGSIGRLIKAIQWCIANEIDIINLSIGTIHRRDEKRLRETVDKADNKGIIIVAAQSNDDLLTYPACFHNVIGVKSDKNNILEEGQFTCDFESSDGIEIIACGRHKLVNYLGEEKTTSDWNSYATPMITALIANIAGELSSPSAIEVRKKLWEKATKKQIEV